MMIKNDENSQLMIDQTTLCNAFAISLAAAIIESVRAGVPRNSALENRLGRAAQTTERAIEYFPMVRDNFDAMFLADQFLPFLEQRINAVIVHGGWRRGERDLDRFFGNMIERLNDPKNIAKGDYLAMTWPEIREKLREELSEVEAEMWKLAMGHSDASKAAAVRELSDLAVVCMIAAAKIDASAIEPETDCGRESCDECCGCAEEQRSAGDI